MDITQFVDANTDQQIGTLLDDAGPHAQRLRDENLHNEGKTRSHVATAFWQAFLGSEYVFETAASLSVSPSAFLASEKIVVPRPGLNRFDLLVLMPGSIGSPRSVPVTPLATALSEGWYAAGSGGAAPRKPNIRNNPDLALEALHAGQPFTIIALSSPKTEPLAVPSPSCPIVPGRAPRTCIRPTREDRNHDAVMRIGGEAPRRRAHSKPRLSSLVGIVTLVGSPSPIGLGLSSAGIVGEDRLGRKGVTAALHAVGAARNVTVAGSPGTVVATDQMSDSCFIELPIPLPPVGVAGQKGPLRWILPRGQQAATFEGQATPGGNWFEIPEIKKAHDDLMAALDKPTVVEKEAYPAFRYACLRSPDLIDKDALALANQQGEWLAKALPAQRTGGDHKQGWELKDLNLYGARRAAAPRA